MKNTKKFYTFLFINFLFILIINFTVINNHGYINRMPKIIQDIIGINIIWDELKNDNGESCNGHIDGCVFNKNFDKKVFIIGDSFVGSLLFNLKNQLTKKKYQIHTYTKGGCILAPGFDVVDIATNKKSKSCNNKFFIKIIEKINKSKNSIIIFGGLYGSYFNDYFTYMENNKLIKKKSLSKYVRSGNFNTVEESFLNTINKLKDNNKIIIIYPIPEVGYDVKNKLLQKIIKEKDYNSLKIEDYITISHKFFLEKQDYVFQILNSLKDENIYRVYPHKLFCNKEIKNECITHDKNSIYYYDGFHLSNIGAKRVNNLIINKINRIENIN